MNTVDISRRGFIQSSAALGAGLSLGIALPVQAATQAMTKGAPQGNEVGIWVMIRPDDTVVIRIARSEMGQGTLTGLAQLVAEELECDWKKVTTEYPTPGENLKRKRAWGSYSTGGSRGIRDSHDYVRQGGAALRGRRWGQAQREHRAVRHLVRPADARGPQRVPDHARRRGIAA